jgi:hypothetical protein
LPVLNGQLGRSFVAATDEFVRVFMTTMAAAAIRDHVYVVASNTQAPFRLTRARAAVAALRDPATPGVTSVYAPTGGRALGFAAGPSSGAAAKANLRPVAIAGTRARLGLATSLPAFQYGRPRPAMNATMSRRRTSAVSTISARTSSSSRRQRRPVDGYRRRRALAAAVLDGFRLPRGHRPPGPLHLRGQSVPGREPRRSPFDRQSAILQRGLAGSGCHYVGDGAFVAGEDLPVLRRYAGPKAQFLALAPWAQADGPRARLRVSGAALAAGAGNDRYVQTALIADLPFPADRTRRGCALAGR